MSKRRRGKGSTSRCRHFTSFSKTSSFIELLEQRTLFSILISLNGPPAQTNEGFRWTYRLELTYPQRLSSAPSGADAWSPDFGEIYDFRGYQPDSISFLANPGAVPSDAFTLTTPLSDTAAQEALFGPLSNEVGADNPRIENLRFAFAGGLLLPLWPDNPPPPFPTLLLGYLSATSSTDRRVFDTYIATDTKPNGMSGKHSDSVEVPGSARGIDVSHLQNEQGPIDWSAVRGGGIEFAYVKATDGKNSADDDGSFKSNIDGADAAEIVTGAYHYARPDLNPQLADAVAEANHFVDHVEQQGQLTGQHYFAPGHLRPALQLNQDRPAAFGTLSEWAQAWVNQVYSRTHVKPMVYTSASGALIGLTDCSLWLSNPDGIPGFGYDQAPYPEDEQFIEQYTSLDNSGVMATFPGIVGPALLDSLNQARRLSDIEIPISAAPWFSASPGSDYVLSESVANQRLTIKNGTATFSGDVSLTNPKLNIMIKPGVIGYLAGHQHVQSVQLEGDSSFIVGHTSGGSISYHQQYARFSMSPQARFDLTVGDLVLTDADVSGSWDGSAYTGTTGLIASGRNGGDWSGRGIVTSSAAGGSLYGLAVAKASDVLGPAGGIFGSETVGPTAALVKYTYGGDANLDGKLNIDDYVRIDQGIAASLTGYSNGDFNYDGKINIDDYTTIIDSNIGNQGPPFLFATDATVREMPEMKLGIRPAQVWSENPVRSASLADLLAATSSDEALHLVTAPASSVAKCSNAQNCSAILALAISPRRAAPTLPHLRRTGAVNVLGGINLRGESPTGSKLSRNEYS